ncbi:unnamed protein product [Rhizophagus irregularis]|nr:unnamed protein product [Rhizophagus irregularis]
MSAEYLNELKIHWEFTKKEGEFSLRFYGITKDPETEEFMMILDIAQKGNLRSFLSRYSHEDFHSGNILQIDNKTSYISDFGLSGPSNKQKSDDKICGEKYQEEEKFGYKGKEIRAMFEEADKKTPNISTSYKKNSDAIYTSRLFTFDNLTKPVNSSIITSYLDDEENNEDNRDSQLVDLEVSSSLLQSEDGITSNENSIVN